MGHIIDLSTPRHIISHTDVSLEKETGILHTVVTANPYMFAGYAFC